MKLIPLSQQGKNKGKYFAQVDDDDYDFLMQWRWSVVNTKSGNLYAQRTTSSSEVNSGRMHRVILQENNREIDIDHKDNNGLNNQKSNLRRCSRSQNQMNKKPSGVSKYLGVCWHKRKSMRNTKKYGIKEYSSCSWKASIYINGKSTHIGLFKSEEDAARAYDDMAIKHHGEFAKLNFPIYLLVLSLNV